MNQLLVQMLIGGGAIAVALAMQTFFIGAALRVQPWLRAKFPHAGVRRMTVLLVGAALWMLLGQTLVVWLWAFLLLSLGAFVALEPAVYYALASFTTVGFGDVVLGSDWRVLGALISAHGMISFGLATAFLIEFILRMQRGG